MDARPVGVFDSGMGGLTVLHELLVTLPHEDFLYLGDAARLPYGPRPLPEISRFAREIGTWLEARDVKLIVVACNAATSAALPDLQSELAVPVVGVITPEAHTAVQTTRNRRVGVLATEATVTAGRYASLIRTLDAGVDVFQVACPALVPLIEGPDPYGTETLAAVKEYAAPLEAAGVDTVILGCTHYPLVAPMLQRTLGRGVSLVTSGAGVARSVERALASRRLLNPRGDEGSYRFRCTADVESFRALGTRFLQMPLEEVVHVELAAAVAA